MMDHRLKYKAKKKCKAYKKKKEEHRHNLGEGEDFLEYIRGMNYKIINKCPFIKVKMFAD